MLANRETSKIGECEVCDAKDIKISVHYGNMWFCDECWSKEQQTTKEHMSPEAQQQRVDAYKSSVESKVLDASRVIDNSIQVRTDLFNANTIAIVELKKAIDENPEITNKPYALAEELKARFDKHQSVIFEMNEKIIEANNAQKAIQVYLNNMANQLRQEEREKLKIADINYQPKPLKSPSVKKVSTTGTKPKSKLDKKELQKYAVELGVSEFTLQMVCVSQGITPEMAANKLRKSINEAKSENTPKDDGEAPVDMDAIGE